MCGICGQYNFDSGAPVEPDAIEAMMATIVHRGPEDRGTHISGPLGLGFRRLSIIDLTPAGHQPMSDETGSIWVVFNGEIYNFQELRNDLIGLGHMFRTKSDTEVIVHGYRQWGTGVLPRLKGMYGVAIWNERERRLLVARDPMGIKPVYFRLDHGTLWFASEIRALLAVMEQKPPVDVAALRLFLEFRYTPADATIHAGIRKLAAGEAIEISEGRARVFRHYRFEPQLLSPQPKPEAARERLLDLYRAAVKRHLISDVPLGLFLSGGLDSGLLLGLMNECGEAWPTFTVGYGEAFRDDELADAAATAQFYHAKHTSVRLDQAEFERALPHIVDVLEEPIASSSIVPMYFVAQRARQDVKVALIGQGPDELLGGYKRHLGVQYGSWWRESPALVRTLVAALVTRLPRNETLKRGVQALAEPERLRRHQRVFSLLPEGKIDDLFQADVLPQGSSERVLASWAEMIGPNTKVDDLGEFQLIELRSSLPDELLMFADKMSMVHSLEARVPYLDVDVVEFIQTLGSTLKIRHGRGKWLHRQVCESYLPREILQRPKRGFAVNVVDSWLRHSRNGKLVDYLGDPKSFIYQYLRFDAVQHLVTNHISSRSDHHKILFSLVLLEEWMRRHTSRQEVALLSAR